MTQFIDVCLVVPIKFFYAFHIKFCIVQFGNEPFLRLKNLSYFILIIMSLYCFYKSAFYLFRRIFHEIPINVFANGATTCVYPCLRFLHNKSPIVFFRTAEPSHNISVFINFWFSSVIERRSYD